MVQLRDRIKELKYSLITEFYAPQRELLIDILRRFDRLYRERKRQAGALDFADLEEFAVRLLVEHPDTRARLQSQFDHILMDEFQDTNGQQAQLLKHLRPPDRFYAVGDINQSIFGFRHAEPQGFSRLSRGHRAPRQAPGQPGRQFPQPAGDSERRRDHRRGAPGIEPRSLVAGRKFEKPRPVCVDVLAATELEMEAQWVARRILELLEAEPEFGFKDVAVLVRNTEVMAAFAAAFDKAGIPYLVNRGKGFYETREVNDLTCLLRVIANPRDEISLAAVLRSPLVAASDESLLRLKIMGDNLGASLMRLAPETGAEFDAEDHARLTRFRDRLREWRIRREYVSFDRLLLAAIDDCGYRGGPNIDKFLAQARDAASPHVAGRIRGGAGAGPRLQPARAGCAAGRFRQRRQGDDRAFRQGSGVSDRVRGGAAQGRGDQSAGGGVFSADRAGSALAQPRRARRQGRSVPARDPRRASQSGRTRKAIGCSTWP